MNRPVRPLELEIPDPPAPMEVGYAAPRAATRTQRVALVAGFLLAVCVALYLFSSILLPFVAAACIAYFLDPATKSRSFSSTYAEPSRSCSPCTTSPAQSRMSAT